MVVCLARVLAVISAMLVVASPTLAVIPGADNPKAYTWHDWAREHVAYEKGLTSEAYKQFGKRDPKWDDAAIRFLESTAVYETFVWLPRIYQPTPLPTAGDCSALAEAAIKAGCDDPLVRTLYIFTKTASGGGAGGSTNVIAAAMTDLSASKYAPIYRARLAAHMTAHYYKRPNDKGVQDEWLARYTNSLGDAALAVKAPDVAHFIEQMNVITRTLKIRETSAPYQAICKRMEAAKTSDPYLLHFLSGRMYVLMAWESRGHGFAGTVTPEGWAGFSANLKLARDQFSKAHALRPTIPYAAAEMIPVAMGGGEALREDPRAWFEKATAAQFDHSQSYRLYREAIMPRWGGTIEGVFAFGLECAQTDRYDTRIPLLLWETVESIDREMGNDGSIYSAKPVSDALHAFAARVAEKQPTLPDAIYYRSRLVAIDANHGRYQQAAAFLDALGDKLDPKAFVGFREPLAALTIIEVRAMASPHAAELKSAEKLARAGERESALKAFEKVAVRVPKDDPAAIYVAGRAQAMRLELAFARGEWVALNPAADLTPWIVVRGQWKREADGTLTGRSDAVDEKTAAAMTAEVYEARSALIVCRADLGPNFEIRYRVRFPDGPESTIGAVVGAWTGGSSESAKIYVVGTPLTRFENSKLVERGLSKEPITVDMTALYRDGVFQNLKKEDGWFTTYPVQPTGAPAPASARAYIGLQVIWGPKTPSVRFSGLEIRRVE